MTNNATCSICGKGYYMCNSCKDIKTLSPYKLHTDTAEHYKVYQILHGFNTGVYSIQEAKAKLQKVDLSDVDSFRDNIKSLIEVILNSNKNKTTRKVKTKESVETKLDGVEKPKSTSKKAVDKTNSNKAVETDKE